MPAGTGDLTIYRVVHANFPKFFLKFFVRNFPAPDAVCSEGLPARCARSLRLCRFGRTNLIVFFYVGRRGHGWPFFWMPFGQRCCVRICTMFLAYSWAKPMGKLVEGIIWRCWWRVLSPCYCKYFEIFKSCNLVLDHLLILIQPSRLSSCALRSCSAFLLSGPL